MVTYFSSQITEFEVFGYKKNSPGFVKANQLELNRKDLRALKTSFTTLDVLKKGGLRKYDLLAMAFDDDESRRSDVASPYMELVFECYIKYD